MPTASRWITVEEFSQLPEVFKLQSRLRELLSLVARVHGKVETELPFRALAGTRITYRRCSVRSA